MGDHHERCAVSRVLDDLWHNISQKRPRRSKTIFFQAVECGDITLISDVLCALKASENNDLLKWVLGEDCLPSSDNCASCSSIESACATPMSVLLITFLMVIDIILTPIIHILHLIIGFIVKITFARPPHEYNLPLTLVSLSQSKEMLEVFKREGLSLFQQDNNNNTVLHDLA